MPTPNLLDSQQGAVSKLSKLKVGALYMDAGTGKTRSALEILKTVPELKYILWLTPYRTKQNLRDELLKWGCTDADIVGIETISSSDREYLRLHNKLNEFGKSAAVVVDESLKIKNLEAKRTKRITELGKLAEYRLILNGTPVSRNLLDVWAQMEFLSPKILKMNFAEFKNTFCEYTVMSRRIAGRTVSKREWINKYHNVQHLYNLIKPYVYECDLDLQVGKQYIDVDFRLSRTEMERYNEIKEHFLNPEKLLMLNNNIFLRMTQKMQYVYTNSEEKYQFLDRFLKENDSKKVLIFRKYIDADLELKRRYPNLRTLSIQSESMGLNLQNYDTIILWDKVWDYALIKQMEHRIWRIGQKNTCRFINLNANVGLDKMMIKSAVKKRDVLKFFKKTVINNL